jgi:hypothetical protein
VGEKDKHREPKLLHYCVQFLVENAGAEQLRVGEKKSEQSANLVRIFVPLCASFVPWRFWKRFVLFVGILLTRWYKT